MHHSLFIICSIIVLMNAHLNDGSIDNVESDYEVLIRRQSSTFTTVQQAIQNQVLRAHNTYRTRHCAPLLVLDNILSRAAQSYAEELARTNRFEHSDGEGYGENLFKMTSTRQITSFHGANATRSWYDEIKFYDFDNPEFSPETGHFTQVIWQETTKLGVGFALGRDGSRYTLYVVARYSPPGNIDGHFEENVVPSQC